jgi:hypothetical protein
MQSVDNRFRVRLLAHIYTMINFWGKQRYGILNGQIFIQIKARKRVRGITFPKTITTRGGMADVIIGSRTLINTEGGKLR